MDVSLNGLQWSLLVLVVACAPGPPAFAQIEVREAHQVEAAAASRCADCEILEVEDPLRGALEVATSGPGVAVHAGAIRAAVALVPPDQTFYRLLLFVDSSTQTELRPLRQGNATPIAVTLLGHISLGELHPLSPWQIDAGLFASELSVREALPLGLKLHVLPDLDEELHDGQPAEIPEDCSGSGQPDVSSSEFVLAQGTMKGSVRHGLWTYVDHRGELLKLEFFRSGCLIDTVAPSLDADVLRLNELMKGAEDAED